MPPRKPPHIPPAAPRLVPSGRKARLWPWAVAYVFMLGVLMFSTRIAEVLG